MAFNLTRRTFLIATSLGVACSGASPIMILTPFDKARSYPLVIYHHGSGENARSLHTDALKQNVIKALRKAGYLIAAHDARGNNWGNSAAVSDYAALLDYVKQKYSISKTVCLSQSMGGLTGLTCLADPRFSAVRGWYGVYPVCSLKASYDLNFAAAIRPAYGIAANGADYAQKTAGSDPALRSASSFPVIRYRFTASYQDTVVPRASHSDVMAGILAGRAIESEIVAAKGDHGDGSHFLPQDVVDFFARC